MYAASSRREFLQALIAGAAGLSVGAAAAAQSAEPFTITSLTPTLRVISGAGGNVVVLQNAAGVVMVNGGSSAHAPRLLSHLAPRAGGRLVDVLFNTDWHPDHTGANEMLGKAGTEILAHEHTRQYLGAELFVDWENRTYPALPPVALPTKTFRTSGALDWGGEQIRYGHLGQAHTDGDIYVLFRDANVLIAGDVMTVGTYPIADYTTGGWLGGLAAATKTLLDLTNADTRVVPGRGPVQTRADLEAQHQMLVAARDKLTKMMRQGLGADDMLAAKVTGEFDARWGEPDLFVTTSYRGLWLHVRELGGIV